MITITKGLSEVSVCVCLDDDAWIECVDCGGVICGDCDIYYFFIYDNSPICEGCTA